MTTPTKQSAYSQISHNGDFDDSRTLNGDSGSDAGDSLIGHRRGGLRRDKNWDEDEHDDHHLRRLGKKSRRWCTSPWVLGTLNVILVIVVLALLLERHVPTEPATTKPAPTPSWEGNGDITGFIPPVGQDIKTFVPDMSFVPENGSDFFTREVKDKWLSLVPGMLLLSHHPTEPKPEDQSC